MYILNKSAQNQLNQQLKLNATGREQDWDIELADSKRLNDFISFWPYVVEDGQLKRALVALLMASYDDYLQAKPDTDQYQAILYELLDRTGNEDIQDIISYWALTDKEDSSDWFDTTPFARGILEQRN